MVVSCIQLTLLDKIRDLPASVISRPTRLNFLKNLLSQGSMSVTDLGTEAASDLTPAPSRAWVALASNILALYGFPTQRTACHCPGKRPYSAPDINSALGPHLTTLSTRIADSAATGAGRLATMHVRGRGAMGSFVSQISIHWRFSSLFITTR